MFKPYLLLLLISIFTVSCNSDDDALPQEELPPAGAYANGMFILNEGGFGNSNASVSFVGENGELSNSIFTEVNNRNLGDVAQSMGFFEDNAYIVVNNSSTVEVVDRYTFEEIATITEMVSSPRYIAFSGNKGFITNWGDPTNANDDFVAVLNLETNLVEAQIPVGEGPEKLLVENGKIYVAHKGGYGFGNAITVIDVASQSVNGTITVADVPDGMVADNGKLYVLCAGKPAYTEDETLGGIYKIDLASQTVESTIDFPETQHPGFLEMENGMLYYTLNNEIFTVNSNSFVLNTTPIFTTEEAGVQVLYGFNVNDGKIYIADAKDYSSNGQAFVFSLQGILQNTFNVGVIPRAFYFENE
ncbi:hypothetical protein KIV10_04120 [Aequorivita echinoideorum]|uniref:40-residue YVTN family beta-propeller repeat-containing protein n=2 Tax=Aequorivita echinoideorum TaxID=1549647 RepID=A0ABS5S6A4_9FLAO|nr:hypothetical protein [Aequorivita echinoideorum]